MEADMESISIVKIILPQAVITVFGLFFAYVKLKQEIHKFRRERVYDLKLERLKRQLSEFYGPLHMLATSTSDIAKKAWGTDMWEEVWREIIVPSQQQIANILLTRIDLLDETDIPLSYFDFLKHVNINRGYLKSGFGKNYFEKNTPYPPQFNEDIWNAYQRKRKEYSDTLQTAG